jgi:hypothetical protein
VVTEKAAVHLPETPEEPIGISITVSHQGESSFLSSRALTLSSFYVIIHTMNARHFESPISDLLRRTIVESGVSYNALQRATGVTRASIMRFVRGSQSLQLDRADRLAGFLGLELRKRG